MPYRRLGKTEYEVSAVGFGAWAIGGDWGPIEDAQSMAALHAAANAGVNFFDTADVYGDGRSERLIGRFLTERDERIYVATKIGRRAPLETRHYTPGNLRAWVDRSRADLSMETLDLVQLHCPPDQIYDMPEIFAALDTLKQDGSIAQYGVSVETIDQAMRAIRHPGVATVQIIFNMFRQKPAEEVLLSAARANVGIIARVPLASGLLAGKFTKETTFPQTDHRNFNREGEAFDVGETFAGIPFETGVEAVEELAKLADGATLAQRAIRWILMFDEVSTVIPGAKNSRQAIENAAAASLPALDSEAMTLVSNVYRRRVAPYVHDRW